MVYVGTGLDANGWTTFTPSSDTHIIYVSSSTGSDSNSGFSQNAAVATIDKGLSLLRDGSADWLLLKAGDTFVDQEIGYLDISGRSGTEPILISSYGTGDRPLIETSPNGSGAAIGGFQGGGSNIAVTGLEFYAYTRDPDNSHFLGDGPQQYGIRFVGTPVDNLLFEDCKFSFYEDSTIEGAGSGDVVLRRNIISDNWDLNTSHSQGLYADRIANLILEQNFFDHNGWNSSVPGAEATIFNHDLYIQTTNGPATVIGNVFADASSHGAQVRSGGTVTDNLFVSDPIGLLVGASGGGVASTVSGNVFLQADDTNGSARGWGIDVNPTTGPVQVLNNIIAHEASTGNNGHGIDLASGTTNDVVQNNVIYDWDNPITNGGSGNITSPNAIDQTGYLDPNRTIETYMASLGGDATLAAFMAGGEDQSKANWNPQYTADAVNNYIEAGFVKTGGSLAGSVSINNVAIAEGDSGTTSETFTVTRSGGTNAFDVNYATSNGSATTADSDYVAKSGTLHFAAGQNTATIPVTINGDTKVEANETFNFNLSGATNGATISDAQGVGTITNDDVTTPPPPPTTIPDTSGNDNLIGTSGNDNLIGTSGNDTISGLAGNDRIDGAGGADTLTGGRGHDTFVFKAGEANGDVVLDFHGSGRSSDQLEFHGYGNGSFTQVDSTHWAIAYENNSHPADVIEILGGVALNDYHFIV